MKAARKLRRLQHPQSLMEHLRQFLTPQVWKQARQAVPRGRGCKTPFAPTGGIVMMSR